VSPLKLTVNVVQFFAAAAALAFVVLLFVNEPDKNAAAGGYQGSDGQIDGSAVFADNCARCHGADAKGGSVAPPLADGKVVEDFPNVDDQIAVVTNGRGGMPPFGGQLSADEIKAVVDYTRSL
jgi:mono/diheme cytochrome c family protein